MEEEREEFGSRKSDVGAAEARPVACPRGRTECPDRETVVADCRPGEIDVSIRCGECGLCRHHVLDDSGKILDDDALSAHRAKDKPS